MKLIKLPSIITLLTIEQLILSEWNIHYHFNSETLKIFEKNNIDIWLTKDSITNFNTKMPELSQYECYLNIKFLRMEVSNITGKNQLKQLYMDLVTSFVVN